MEKLDRLVADHVEHRLLRCTSQAGRLPCLCLSITYDIVAKTHGGTIVVDRAVNEFTEFVVTQQRGMFANVGSTG